MPTEFRPRFPVAEVMFWAARYSDADDAEVEAMGRAARARGWYTRDEFLTVTRWKTPRSRSKCESNDEASVEAATRLALSTPDEQIRIESFSRLRGVAYPTASVLLHFACPDAYPIIDVRALWSLGWDSPPMSCTFAFWWEYTVACRSLAKNAGVTVRTLNRALWQYSKEHQPLTSATRYAATDQASQARKGQTIKVPTKQYQIGKPFDIEELKKPVRARAVSARDQELEKAITQAAAGAASQVFPFLFDPEKDKIGTVLAAARRIVKTMGVPVNVGVNAAMFPNAILLSRGILSNRGRHTK
jgi:hypothetical protein